MTTFSGVYASKTSWQLQLDVSESSLDAVANTSYVGWALYIYRGNSDYPWNNASSPYSVSGPGGVSTSFPGYDFQGTHSGTNYSGTPVGGRVLIASGGATVTHDADGSKSVTFSASHTSGSSLGNGAISSSTFTLTTLTQAPGVPSSVALAYVSDTQSTVSWTNNSATNGQPTSNQIQTSVNGAAYTQVASIATATSLNITTAANQKILAKVRETNTAGSGAYSTASNTVYTTPAAPTSVTAAKDPSLNIVVTWTDNVAYTEHNHKVEAASSTDGGTTWSSWAVLTSAGTGGSYTDATPDAAKLWKYRVSAINTDTAALTSAAVTSNTVQLLAAPNKPTLAGQPSFLNKAADFVPTWVHNPVDSTAQTAYEFGYSTNGGTTWSTTGKVTSTVSSKTFTGGTYAANVALTIRVRDWGQATTGGSEGTGASPWSDQLTVTFKTLPVASITSPAASSVVDHSALSAVLGFSQAESATFVQATIDLYDATPTLLEEQISTVLSGTAFDTRLLDGGSYSLKATVTDSNGLTSAQVTSAFTVSYASPPTPAVAPVFDADSGMTQVGLTFPTPTGSEVAATTVTLSRTFNGVVETIVTKYPITGSTLTFLDTTPGLNGTNTYAATSYSADGAAAVGSAGLAVPQGTVAYLNSGTDFSTVVKFFLKPSLSSTPSRDSSLVRTAGRTKPVALYGVNTNFEVSGSGEIQAGQDSTVEDIEGFLKTAGRGCYRDGSGRRVFGQISGAISNRSPWLAEFSFKIVEAS